MDRRGFTLVELLIFVAIFTLAIAAFITIFISVVGTQSQESYKSEVQTQGQFLLQQVQYYVSSARLVDMTIDSATTSLTLRETNASSSLDPTTITLASGTVYLAQGNGAAQALTSDKVAISNLSFTRHYNVNSSSSPYGTDSVSFSFTISSANVAVGDPQYYSQGFQGSAPVLTPVPVVALVQQASSTNNNVGVSTVNASFTASNASGSLLIALISNVGTSTATTSISDTASNTWAMAASTSYPAYSQKSVIYYAANVKNSSDTVTVNFGAGVNYPTLFLYEYRGAATSSPFDASSTQNLSNTATPSSSPANATSAVELLFGTMYSNPSTEIPAPGKGFTLETTSSISATYVEDRNAYVTGPVGADWTYSSTAPSSSAAIVTFKAAPLGSGSVVVFDSVASSSVSGTTTLSWSHTVTTSGSNRLLIVGAVLGCKTSDSGINLSATYDGASMATAATKHGNNGTTGFAQLFYLANPAVGTHAVEIVESGMCDSTNDLIGGSISFTGVDQANPLTNVDSTAGSGTTSTITINSASGDMVVDVGCNGSGMTSSNQTLRWLTNVDTATACSNGAQSTAAGSTTVSMGYTMSNDNWALIGADIQAAR